MGETQEPIRTEIKGQLSPGLVLGGLFIGGVGGFLYWVYFHYEANPPTLVGALLCILVGLLFIYLAVAAYASSFVIDSQGIAWTSLFGGLRKTDWDEVESAVEKPGLEPGIFQLRIQPRNGKPVDIYSNWVDDYDLLLSTVDALVEVDTSASRVEEQESSVEARQERPRSAPDSEAAEPVPRKDLRARVTSVQILYLLGMLIVTVAMFWRAFLR